MIRNANRLNLRAASLTENLSGNGQLRGPDFIRIVFNPPGFWENLAEFLLCYRSGSARPVKQDGSGAGRALIECKYVRHGYQGYRNDCAWE